MEEVRDDGDHVRDVRQSGADVVQRVALRSHSHTPHRLSILASKQNNAKSIISTSNVQWECNILSSSATNFFRATKVRATKVRATKVRTTKVRATKVRATKVRATKVRGSPNFRGSARSSIPLKVRATKVRATKVRTIKAFHHTYHFHNHQSSHPTKALRTFP